MKSVLLSASFALFLLISHSGQATASVCSMTVDRVLPGVARPFSFIRDTSVELDVSQNFATDGQQVILLDSAILQAEIDQKIPFLIDGSKISLHAGLRIRELGYHKRIELIDQSRNVFLLEFENLNESPGEDDPLDQKPDSAYGAVRWLRNSRGYGIYHIQTATNDFLRTGESYQLVVTMSNDATDLSNPERRKLLPDYVVGNIRFHGP